MPEKPDWIICTASIAFSELDRAVIDGQPQGICKLIVSNENHRILGVHVAGEQALEVIHLVAVGIISGLWVEQLAEMEIAYPTFAAVVGLAARQDRPGTGRAPTGTAMACIGTATCR